MLYRNFLDLWFHEPAQQSVLPAYGRSNPAEFFAVATEAFFETPDVLESVLPDLYFILKRFYGASPDPG